MKITLSSNEKSGIKIEPKKLSTAIASLEYDKATEISDVTRWTAQLQSLLAVFEEAQKQDAMLKCLDGTRISDIYKTDKDKELKKEIDTLAEEWRSSLVDGQRKLFNMDGFYPYYTSMTGNLKKKILFVGREACYMADNDYMSTVYSHLVKNDFNGWTLNQYPFHRRQFYLAYGIMSALKNGGTAPKWDDVPWASEMVLGDTAKNAKRIFAADGENSISWAFINLSKLSNETGDYRTDSARYVPFVSDQRNQAFIREEIRLLKPDVIIGANVFELVGILDYDAEKVDTENESCYYYAPVESEKFKDRLPPFLNCYHFAAIKSDGKCFYDPVMQVLEKNWNDLGFESRI